MATLLEAQIELEQKSFAEAMRKLKANRIALDQMSKTRSAEWPEDVTLHPLEAGFLLKVIEMLVKQSGVMEPLA